MSSLKQPVRPLFLGIEGGGSHTVAILADANHHLVQRFEAGPANLRLLSDDQLLVMLQTIAAALPGPDAVGIGLAGARSDADRARIRAAAAKVWPGISAYATNDLETALMAAEAKSGEAPGTRVLVLSGTGSCCYGRNTAGQTTGVGGWGHILGDKGSGFEIGLRALKAVIYYFDRDDKWPKLGERLLHRLQLNEPNDLIAWVQNAPKTDVAALAVQVFNAWHEGDKIATDILNGAKETLAKDAVACAKKLTSGKGGVHFVLTGSVLLKQPKFARALGTRLKQLWPGAMVSPLERESVWGAVTLTEKNWQPSSAPKKSVQVAHKPKPTKAAKSLAPEFPLSQLVKLSPTEQRNPRSLKLDQLSVAEAIELMLSEDEKIPAAIRVESKKIARAVGLVAQSFKQGGRLFYIGAGTSGRLGVLDASECPPTFRTDPKLVQGIMAGGQGALWSSVEGAEDDPVAGARAIEFRGVTKKDVVVGIAASGRTPYVWGALGEAKRRGAKTILLAFNPFLKVARTARPDLMITPNVGPEILTGSTRLKSGTATKLVLNMLTTLAMVRTGKVVSNLMVDLNPSNIKLQDRAVRIVRELANVDYATAKDALEKAGWVIKPALKRLSAGKNR